MIFPSSFNYWLLITDYWVLGSGLSVLGSGYLIVIVIEMDSRNLSRRNP